jgi:TatD DNase family protein
VLAVDAHAHLRAPPSVPGVGAWVQPGVDPAQDARVQAPGVLHAAGLHPWYLGATEAQVRAQLARLDPRGCVAIGETGLDRGRRGAPKALQELAFRAQIELATRHRLPLILHVVRAHGACLERLAGFPGGGMVHDFGGAPENAARWADAGFFLSVSPRAGRKPEAVAAIPDERLLVETDDEGPEALPDVLRLVAGIRGSTPERVAELTAANAARLFPQLGG